MIQGVGRRLQRLEARSAAVNADRSLSILIHFVNMQRVVTSTLLLQSGEPNVWTHFTDDRATCNSIPAPE